VQDGRLPQQSSRRCTAAVAAAALTTAPGVKIYVKDAALILNLYAHGAICRQLGRGRSKSRSFKLAHMSRMGATHHFKCVESAIACEPACSSAEVALRSLVVSTAQSPPPLSSQHTEQQHLTCTEAYYRTTPSPHRISTAAPCSNFLPPTSI
jgi:hypothetical protein